MRTAIENAEQARPATRTDMLKHIDVAVRVCVADADRGGLANLAGEILGENLEVL